MLTNINLTEILEQRYDAGQFPPGIGLKISMLAKSTIDSIKSRQDTYLNETHFKSTCFYMLTCSLEEFLKNSIDAGATQINIAINIEEDQISIKIIDNGRGFPSSKVSAGPIPYELDRTAHGTSHKLGDSTMLGGQNIGLLQTATVLQKNSGNLYISNRIVDGEIAGACLMLVSSLAEPTYTLDAYQLEHAQSTSIRPVSVGTESPAIGDMLGSISSKIAAVRAAKAARSTGGTSSFSGSPFSDSFAGSPAGFGGSFSISPLPAHKGSPIIDAPSNDDLSVQSKTLLTEVLPVANPAAGESASKESVPVTFTSLYQITARTVATKESSESDKENTTPIARI